MFSYNVTPHSSTGYSPYFLMYGRHPNLPIDFMLGRNTSPCSEVNLERWIELHSEKMTYAYNKAKEEITRNEEDRKKRHDGDRDEEEMEIGDSVYVRNRGIKGRDKIQDKWKPDIYVIVDKPFHSVYTVKPENSDAGKRTVNRTELKPVVQ